MNNQEIRALSDSDLATCVDEYMKRIIAVARSQEYDKNIFVSVVTSQYSPDGEYTIHHKVGGGYDKQNVESANALEGVRIFVRRWREDQGMAPQVVVPMLAPPAPAPEPEYSEYEEVSTDVEDDIPL